MYVDKLKGIIKGTYELTQDEVELEDKIWHDRIAYCWGIDTDLVPTEEESEAKKKQAEYMHNYYITRRKKQSTKIMDMSDTAIKRRASMSKLRNRLCLYEGEQLKYGTLQARLHNQLGYSWPDAKKICDEALIKED
jgi:hypothetical protein